jgi:hypothetical protein
MAINRPISRERKALWLKIPGITDAHGKEEGK